jgi:hypothetical protein
MNSVGILKLTQLRKLFKIFNSSTMQSLKFFGAKESFHFEFVILSYFEYLENSFFPGYWAGPLIHYIPLFQKDCITWRAARLPLDHVADAISLGPAAPCATCFASATYKRVRHERRNSLFLPSTAISRASLPPPLTAG